MEASEKQTMSSSVAPTTPDVNPTTVKLATNGNAIQGVTKAPVNVTSSTRRPSPSQQHVLSQVNKIVGNSYQLNITGIVDESLRVAPVAVPVRNLVNGILNVVFCSTFEFFSPRCRNRVG